MDNVKNYYNVDYYCESKFMDTMAMKEHRFHKSVHHHLNDVEERLTEKIDEHDNHLSSVETNLKQSINTATNTINSHTSDVVEEAKDDIIAEINSSENNIINSLKSYIDSKH